ncbi:S-layer homology domain-containing protein [Candidatus Saganbacteria bacterium]|nr:S-layer homology domain-containing protein [Candidatus Saganbacteria bacterium]
MGKAYLGRADDIGSLFINPAGLANIKEWQATSMSGKFINEFNYLNLGFAYPTRFGTFGFGFTGSDISFSGPAAVLESIDGVRVVPSTTETVSYGYNNSVMLLGYGGKAREDLAVGLTLKLFSPILTGPQITGGTARGFDADLGFLYEPRPAVRMGVTVQNFVPYSLGGKIRWGNGQEESFPSTLKTGLSLILMGEKGIRKFGQQELKFNFDGDFTPLRPTIPSLYHLGLEWSPVLILDLRLGIDQDIIGKGGGLLDVSNNFTTGVGIYLDGFRFDYAFHQYYGAVENDTHYFSVSYGIFREPPPKVIKEHLHVIAPADRAVFYTDKVPVLAQALDPEIKRITVAGRTWNATAEEIGLGVGKNLISVEGWSAAGRKVETIYLRELRLLSFKDVDEIYWARPPIERLATLGILRGYPDGDFKPQERVRRQDLAALLARLISPEAQTEVADPKRYVTRAEAVTMIYNFGGVAPVPVLESPFPDIPGRYWAAGAIYAAKSAGILKYLEGGNFLPGKELTRAEMAELLSRVPSIKARIDYLLDFERGFAVK